MSRPVSHGTHSGYTIHIRERTVPCEACCAANTQYMTAYRLRRGLTKSVNVPAAVLGAFLRDLDEEAGDRAAQALGQEVAAVCMELAGLNDIQGGVS